MATICKMNFPNRFRRRCQGITLVESMVVVAILGILAAIAVPSFKSTIESSRRTTYANQLLEDLALARSEAIKRGVRVTVCPSTNGTSCSGATSWATGWITYVDLATFGTRDAASEALIRVHEALPSGWTATKNNNVYVTYGPMGTPSGVTNFTLAICPTSAACTTLSTSSQSNVIMSTVGRVRIENYN